MKKLYLIGDSTREGFEPLVREKLSGRAEVFSPGCNCEFAQYTLRHLHDWVERIDCAKEIDVVHWNNGLWDTLHLFGDECLTPPDVYASMLRRIHKRIGVIFPHAKVIFALSTPVIEELFSNPAKAYRLNADTREYNNIASRIMKELKVEIDDLFTAASGFSPDLYADHTHFTREGYDILADVVVKACEPYLFGTSG
jgi:hypothetical protein